MLQKKNSITRLTIKYLLQLLNAGGKLVIANCSLDMHGHRYFMEFGVDWYLIYRNNDDLQQLAKGIAKAKNYHINEIEQGIIKFLVIEC